MRRIGRRIGLGQASAIGLCSMISALALAAAAPMAVAQSADNGTPSAGAPVTVENAAAPATPATPSEPSAVPVEAAASPSASNTQAPASAPTAADASAAAEASSQGARSGGGSVRPAQTRYSKRHKGSMGAGAAAAEAAKPGTPAEVVCRAGCDQLPGSVVHMQQPATLAAAAALATDDDDDDDTPKAKTQAKVADPSLTCVAGCYEQAPSFAGLPNATEGGYAFTKSKLPGTRPGSGEWMVRINRERATEPGK